MYVYYSRIFTLNRTFLKVPELFIIRPKISKKGSGSRKGKERRNYVSPVNIVGDPNISFSIRSSSGKGAYYKGFTTSKQ